MRISLLFLELPIDVEIGIYAASITDATTDGDNDLHGVSIPCTWKDESLISDAILEWLLLKAPYPYVCNNGFYDYCEHERCEDSEQRWIDSVTGDMNVIMDALHTLGRI